MAAIGASLSAYHNLELLAVSAPPAEAVPTLVALRPDAVVFDQTTTASQLTGALLHALPDLLLIGVDPASDRILILSGRQERPVSAAELCRLITGGDAASGGSAP